MDSARDVGRLIVLVGVLGLPGQVHAQPEPAPTGQFLVLTQPSGAQVFVDGRGVGPSPVSVPDLLPGPHLVVAVSEDGAHVERVVDAIAGNSISVQLTFDGGNVTAVAGGAAMPRSDPTTAGSTSPVAADGETVEREQAAAAAPARAAPLASEPSRTLPESDLSDLSEAPASGATQDVHVEDERIMATGHPGLLGPTLGLRFDIPVYTEHPSEGLSQGALVGSRLTLEWGANPTLGLIHAIDFPNGGFGFGLGINLPRYVPLARAIALALQPRLAFIAYLSTLNAALLSAEFTLRLGFSPIPHLVLGVEAGAVLTGVVPFDGSRSTLVGGAYVGPMLGGGIEWAFY